MINSSRSKNFSYIKVCGFSVLHPKKNFSNLAKYTTGSYATSDIQLVLNIKSRAIMAASSTITLRISLKQTANKWIMFSPNLKVWKAWIYWSVTRAQDQPVWVSCVGRAVAMVPQYLKTAGDKYCNTTKIYSRKIPGIIFKVGHAFPCMSRACNHGQQRSHQHTKLEGSWSHISWIPSLKRILKAFRASTLSICTTKIAISPAEATLWKLKDRKLRKRKWESPFKRASCFWLVNSNQPGLKIVHTLYHPILPLMHWVFYRLQFTNDCQTQRRIFSLW